jgi:hypothetical protein
MTTIENYWLLAAPRAGPTKSLAASCWGKETPERASGWLAPTPERCGVRARLECQPFAAYKRDQQLTCPRRGKITDVPGLFSSWVGSIQLLRAGCLSLYNSVVDANLIADALSRKVEKRRCSKKLATIRQSDAFGAQFVLPVLG